MVDRSSAGTATPTSARVASSKSGGRAQPDAHAAAVLRRRRVLAPHSGASPTSPTTRSARHGRGANLFALNKIARGASAVSSKLQDFGVDVHQTVTAPSTP